MIWKQPGTCIHRLTEIITACKKHTQFRARQNPTWRRVSENEVPTPDNELFVSSLLDIRERKNQFCSKE